MPIFENNADDAQRAGFSTRMQYVDAIAITQFLYTRP